MTPRRAVLRFFLPAPPAMWMAFFWSAGPFFEFPVVSFQLLVEKIKT